MVKEIIMGIEIEKKFLLKNDDWRELGPGVDYCQGYLNTEKSRTVRVRTIGNKGFLTIKGISRGAVRQEFEYEIPIDDAKKMLDTLCKQPLIRKKRYRIKTNDMVWEVDEFFDGNEGLVLAEVELAHEHQEFTIPDWVSREVTGDPRYYNSSLVKTPYSSWDNNKTS